MLHCARRGDAIGLAECLERGADPNCHENDRRQNALMVAVEEGAVDCVAALAAHPLMDLSAVDADKRGAWCQAARAAEPECMELIARAFEARATLDSSLRDWSVSKDGEGADALQSAVRAGCSRCARIARESGADPRAADVNGATALIWAAMSGDSGLLEIALPGSDAKARDSQGRDALTCAAFKGDEAAVERLLPLSDPLAVSAKGESALIVACARGHAGCARVLAPVSKASMPGGELDAYARCVAGDHAECMVALADAWLSASLPGARLLAWAQLLGRARAVRAPKCAAAAQERAEALAQRLDLQEATAMPPAVSSERAGSRL